MASAKDVMVFPSESVTFLEFDVTNIIDLMVTANALKYEKDNLINDGTVTFLNNICYCLCLDVVKT